MSDQAKLLEQFKNQAVKQLNETGVSKVDDGALDEIVNRLRTIVANKDATLVSGKDEAELETVRKNFVVKHCGVSDKDKGMSAVKEVAEKMSGVHMKNRAAFYYHLKKKLG